MSKKEKTTAEMTEEQIVAEMRGKLEKHLSTLTQCGEGVTVPIELPDLGQAYNIVLSVTHVAGYGSYLEGVQKMPLQNEEQARYANTEEGDIKATYGDRTPIATKMNGKTVYCFLHTVATSNPAFSTAPKREKGEGKDATEADKLRALMASV